MADVTITKKHTNPASKSHSYANSKIIFFTEHALHITVGPIPYLKCS